VLLLSLRVAVPRPSCIVRANTNVQAQLLGCAGAVQGLCLLQGSTHEFPVVLPPITRMYVSPQPLLLPVWRAAICSSSPALSRRWHTCSQMLRWVTRAV
jgi:hypothetical protein